MGHSEQPHEAVNEQVLVSPFIFKMSVFGVNFPYFRASHFLIQNCPSGKEKIGLAIF
jgi:hypothetical protein